MGHHLTLFIIGIIFSVIGLVGSIVAHRKKGLFILFLVLGTGAILLTTIGPLANTQKRIDKIIKIDSRKVVKIEISSTRTTYASLVTGNTIIRNSESIDDICFALNQSLEIDAGFLKSPDSCCRVRITMKDNSYILFGVRSKGAATSIEVYSNGESGWHYGKIEANDFGKVLKKLLHQRNGQ